MYANPAAEASAGKDALHSGWVSKQTTTLTDKGKRTRRSSVTQLVQGYEPLFAVLRPKTIAFYKEPVVRALPAAGGGALLLGCRMAG